MLHFWLIEAKLENLIGDRAYIGDPLDEELRNDGIETSRVSFQSQQAPTQDWRRQAVTRGDAFVERFFA